MGKCKVIPFRKPLVPHKKSLWVRIFEKVGLIGKKNNRRSRVVVRGFGPGALPVPKRDQKA